MFSWLKSTKKPPSVAKRQRIRPMVEVLEDRTVPTIGLLTNFAGMDVGDGGGAVPPDTDAAVGPSHIMEVVNSSVAIYTKTGTQVSIQSLNAFFGAAGSSLFDPVVTYDDIAGRFIVAALELDLGGGISNLWVACSNSSDPTAGFTETFPIDVVQTIGLTDYWGDYPKIGWNADAVVVTLNMFDFPTGLFFDHVQVVTMQTSLLTDQNPGTNPVTSQVNRPPSDFTMAAASMHGAVPGGPMYFVTDAGFSGTSIDVITMTNVLSAAPTFATTNLAVNAYGAGLTPDADQPGGTITTNDSRMLNSEWRNNRLVATHNVGIGTVAAARWYEIDTTGAPTLIQQGDILPGAGISTYMPAIAIAPDGSLGMSYMQSSSTEFISVYVTGRAAFNPVGTMQTPVLVKAGEATYTGPDRSGDYSGISIDPVSGTFWAANEYASAGFATRNWGTWIVNFTITSILSDSAVYHPLRYIFNSPPFGNAPAPGYRGNITLINRATFAFAGPITFLFPNLPTNVTLTNPTGTTASGIPFITIPGPINAGSDALVTIQLQNPDDESLGTYFLGFPVSVIDGIFDPNLL